MDANGTAGAAGGYDKISISGALSVPTSGQVTIKIVADAVSNFNKTSTYTWTLASASGGINNYSAIRFNIDTSDFTDQNAIDDSFHFQNSRSGGDLRLSYTHVPEPGSAMLLGGAAMAWVGGRRRRRGQRDAD
jgi:hypothetical protein